MAMKKDGVAASSLDSINGAFPLHFEPVLNFKGPPRKLLTQTSNFGLHSFFWPSWGVDWRERQTHDLAVAETKMWPISIESQYVKEIEYMKKEAIELQSCIHKD
ncbi:hypothetical protein BELL_0117g00120 [Botrytis elliptica]|uniref:Uncharacterized protein n=1 Tax=Botrytis elliptica TaxID=278938 RepID=A0A4Z1JUG7_9HELO|nr:hypothetical protein BELL_0117g00120 [Botrytis elliptica]